MCHLVALRDAVSRCPRTYSGRDSCPITVGAHRRLFHGQPRTGRAGGMFQVYARRSVGSWHFGDRDDGVPASGTPGLMSVRRARPSLALSPHQTEPGCPVGGSAATCTLSVGTGPRPRSRWLHQLAYLLVRGRIYLRCTSARGVYLDGPRPELVSSTMCGSAVRRRTAAGRGRWPVSPYSRFRSAVGVGQSCD